jgi:hypothetical protein
MARLEPSLGEVVFRWFDEDDAAAGQEPPPYPETQEVTYAGVC